MCDAPVYIKHKCPRLIPAPKGQKAVMEFGFNADCGKCLPCLKKRKAQWSFRLMEEKREAFSSYFVTLTYNDKWLPYGDNGCTGSIGDHQEFIKWLKYYEEPVRLSERYSISQDEQKRDEAGIGEYGKLKYYGIIEYGDKEGRVHLHYILFNLVDIGSVRCAWAKQMRISKGNYKPVDPKGRIDIDECNQNTIDYVLKYMVKTEMDGDFDDKQREISFMSKGLGKGFINDYTLKHIRQAQNNHVINSRGNRVPLPRYFKKKYLTEEENEAKANHIRKEVKKQTAKVDAQYIRQGRNPDHVRFGQAKERFHIIKNRKKRELR